MWTMGHSRKRRSRNFSRLPARGHRAFVSNETPGADLQEAIATAMQQSQLQVLLATRLAVVLSAQEARQGRQWQRLARSALGADFLADGAAAPITPSKHAPVPLRGFHAAASRASAAHFR